MRDASNRGGKKEGKLQMFYLGPKPTKLSTDGGELYG